MSEFLFTYGTLRSGLAPFELPSELPSELVEVVARLHSIGTGFAQGRLYDLGEYPGAVLESAGSARIKGEVFQLPDDETTLAALDAYEGFDPQDFESSLFVRLKSEITIESDAKLVCWIYV